MYPFRFHGIAIVLLLSMSVRVAFSQDQTRNLAVVAAPSTSVRSGGSPVFLNDGLTPVSSSDMRSGSNRSPVRLANPWIEYEWSQPVTTSGISVFWWNFENSVRLPRAYKLTWWNGDNFEEVKNPVGLGIVNNKFNTTTFDPVKTTS